jgi:hypothetical protein
MEARTKAALRWTEQMRACGRRIDDPNFETTLMLHELGAMRMRGEHEAILERLDVQAATAAWGEWGPLFERVLRASTLARLARIGEIGPSLSPRQVRTVLGIGDPMMVVCIGEAAAAVGDRALASRVHDVLQPRRGRCVSWGVLGLSWDGPVDRVLGLLEAALGREDEARRSFDAAAELCRRLETPLHLRVVEEDRSRALKRALAEPEAESAPRAIEPIALRLEGETWTVAGHTPALRFKDTKGMGMLARLLAEPGREFHVLDLSGALGADTGDAGPLLDERARTEYRRRADDLRSDLAEAEAFNDTARAERAREELDALSRELGRAVGLGGRPRASKSAVERSRVNVQRRIKDAIVRIRGRDEAIGRHLERSVRTGTYCAYEPD